MMRKTAFIGHRNFLPKDIEQRLKIAVQNEIDSGCNKFIIGSHGEFDKTLLSVLLFLKEIYPEIKIEVVITNFRKSIRDEFVIKEKPKYETVMFEIEELYYKQRIGKNNK